MTFSELRRQNFVSGAGGGATWSRPILPGAGAGVGADPNCRSRLWDLGLPEPEPPKKVAAPQH